MIKLTKTKRIAFDAILTAIALTIFVVELHIPAITPIPGIKLGLSNIVTLVTMFLVGPIDALAVLILRVTLGSVLTGQMTAFIYSMAGGLLSYFLMLIMRKFLRDDQVFICSILCAIVHNIGQVLVAILITQTTAIVFYLPILCVSGILTGTFTGFAAQFSVKQLKKIIRNT